MRTLIVLCGIGILGCGTDDRACLVKPGVYKAKLKVVESTCEEMKVGDTGEARWTIDKLDGYSCGDDNVTEATVDVEYFGTCRCETLLWERLDFSEDSFSVDRLVKPGCCDGSGCEIVLAGIGVWEM